MAADLVSGAPFAGNVDPRLQARVLFWQGWRISDIARLLGLKPTVVYSWKTRDGWEGGEPLQRVAASAEMRLHFLINQPKKSDADYKEIRQLTGLLSGGRSSERPSVAWAAMQVFYQEPLDGVPQALGTVEIY